MPEYYCTECFDAVLTFDEEENVLPQAAKASDQLSFDGIDHESVLQAANRLYFDIQPQKLSPTSFVDKRGYPDQAFNWPSNSPQNHVRRVYKQSEIEDTLAEAERYEKAMADVHGQAQHNRSRDSSPDVSVLITRPAYIERRKDRYKKQGLTRYDWMKYNDEKKRDEFANTTGPKTPLASPVKPPGKVQERFCYCCEADDGTAMLKCNSELCPVGWFHLRCTGLDRLPIVNEQSFCCYCSKTGDAFVTKAMSEEGDGLSTESNTPLTKDFACAQPQQADQDFGREPKDKGADISQIQNALTMPEPISPQTGTSTLSSQNISILTSDSNNNTASPQTPDAPVTPSLQPIRQTVKHWGTPINVDKLKILKDLSGSPKCKRKRDLVDDEDLEHNIRVDTDCEILASDEGGEVITIGMDFGALRECNR